MFTKTLFFIYLFILTITIYGQKGDSKNLIIDSLDFLNYYPTDENLYSNALLIVADSIYLKQNIKAYGYSLIFICKYIDFGNYTITIYPYKNERDSVDGSGNGLNGLDCIVFCKQIEQINVNVKATDGIPGPNSIDQYHERSTTNFHEKPKKGKNGEKGKRGGNGGLVHLYTMNLKNSSIEVFGGHGGKGGKGGNGECIRFEREVNYKDFLTDIKCGKNGDYGDTGKNGTKGFSRINLVSFEDLVKLTSKYDIESLDQNNDRIPYILSIVN